MFLKQTDATALVLVAFSIRKSGEDRLPNVAPTGDASGERSLQAKSQRVSEEQRSI